MKLPNLTEDQKNIVDSDHKSEQNVPDHMPAIIAEELAESELEEFKRIESSLL
jgi:hypothetical protein